MLLLLGLSACDTPEETHGPALAGTVTADDGATAEVVATQAFVAGNGAAARWLVTANADATCADAAAYYGNDTDFNAADVASAGHCMLDLWATTYDGAGNYDGSADVTVTLACAMDDGAWVYETRTGRKAWYYDGPYWTGSPVGLLDYALELGAVEEDAAAEFTLSIEGFDGRYPYDNDEPEADPATGTVSGWVSAEWCGDMDAAL